MFYLVMHLEITSRHCASLKCYKKLKLEGWINNFGENQISLQIKVPKVEKIDTCEHLKCKQQNFKLISFKTTLPPFLFSKTFCIVEEKLNIFVTNSMKKSFKMEGVRRGFYATNFSYFLKSNLRNLGKYGFSVFFFLFSKH